MARQADDSGVGGAPFAKFNECGDTLVGAYGGGKMRQQQDFSTREPKFKRDGKPLQELVMHFVAMPGTTAKTGNPDNPDPIAEGDHVRYAVSGFKWSQVIDQARGLPDYAGFKAGTMCSGDIYTITLVGWSAETENASAATAAGFTVKEGRIVLRSQEEKDRYVLAQSKRGGNTNPAKDFEITIRRPGPEHKRWEQLADELFDSKPWERQPAMSGSSAVTSEYDPATDEPF